MAHSSNPTSSTSAPLASVTRQQFTHPKGLGKVALGAALIGLVCGIHLMTLCLGILYEAPRVIRWSVYALYMVVFHFMEFIMTALYHPESVSYDSMLLNHSKEYSIAAVAAWVEYGLECLLVPTSWSLLWPYDFVLGLVLVTGGQFFRSLAMWTAQNNFNHKIQGEKANNHELVTDGVYLYLRHPGYFGWFWWSIGTQVLLGNPVCTVMYSFASWSFFKERIPYEEMLLEQFFGDKYTDYRKRTATGIPFMK